MRSTTTLLRLALLAAVLVALPASAAAQSEGDLQASYQAHLSSLGLDSFVDGDGDVRFEREGRNYFIEVNEEDPEFFRLVLFNIWPIESVSERANVLRAMDEVNGQLKVVKANTVGDNVWLSVELFLADPFGYRPLFERSLQVIERAVDVFVGAMD